MGAMRALISISATGNLNVRCLDLDEFDQTAQHGVACAHLPRHAGSAQRCMAETGDTLPEWRRHSLGTAEQVVHAVHLGMHATFPLGASCKLAPKWGCALPPFPRVCHDRPSH